MISISDSKPVVDASRLALDMATSCMPNSPRMNSTRSMGSRNTAIPTMAGRPSSITMRTPQSMVREKSAGSASTCFLASAGRITVLMATANRPRGNSSRRSE
ncbi:hypothetical protein D3C85_1401310 [compost metagenome]